MTKPKLRFKDKNGNAYPEWSQEKIGNLTQIYDGTHQTPKYTDKGIKFLSVENISDIQASNKFISEEAYNREFKIKPEVNDILMTRIGDIGTPALIDTNEQYAYYVSLALIKCSRKLFPKWLVQAISSNSFQKQLYKRTLHVAFPKKINKGEIGECIVNYPCLEEQEKIAGFLSKVDEFINECEGEVKDLEEQKKGLMQKIFSQQIRFKDSNNNPYPDWEEEKIKNVTSYVDYRGKTPPKTQKGIFLITAKNIKKGFIDYNCSKEYVAEKNYAKIMSRGCPQIGDVLITTEAPCGNVAQIDIVPVALAQRVIKLRGISNIMSNNFLKYLLLSDNFQLLLLSKSTGGTVKGIKGSVFHELPIKFPCLEEQEKIAKVLSKMDELIEEKKALLSDWQQFKKGLLQQMFV